MNFHVKGNLNANAYKENRRLVKTNSTKAIYSGRVCSSYSTGDCRLVTRAMHAAIYHIREGKCRIMTMTNGSYR